MVKGGAWQLEVDVPAASLSRNDCAAAWAGGRARQPLVETPDMKPVVARLASEHTLMVLKIKLTNSAHFGILLCAATLLLIVIRADGTLLTHALAVAVAPALGD